MPRLTHSLSCVVLASCLALLCPQSARAELIRLQNDSVTGTTGSLLQLQLLEGDIPCAVFDPDPSVFPLTVASVEILWGSLFGHTGDTMVRAVHVFVGGENGPVLVGSLDFPVFEDGVLNVCDLSGLGIVIESGPIFVGVELLSPNGWLGATVLIDGDGCLVGDNALFSVLGGWLDGCLLSLGGDLVIRLLGSSGDGDPTPGPEITSRWGNVDTGDGSPAAPVLFVNGSIGEGDERELEMTAGPSEVSIIKPPAGGSGLYAFWIFDGEPTADTVTEARAKNGAGGVQSLGLAPFCLPTNNVLAPNDCPCPLTFPVGYTSKVLFGQATANRLCLHQQPRDPFPPAAFSVDFPVGTFTVTGLILDPNAPSPGPRKIALTNSVVCLVSP